MAKKKPPTRREPKRYVVGRSDGKPLPNRAVKTRRFATSAEATAFIETLPDHKKGIYYLDSPETSLAPGNTVTVSPGKLTARLAAQLIGWACQDWKGCCWAVAEAIRQADLIPDAKTCYGMYTGPIAKDGYFGTRNVSRHGWLVLPDKTIVDPTRWVFENVKPYLAYIQPGDDRQSEYDLGASVYHGQGGPPGPLDAPTTPLTIPWSPDVARLLGALFGPPGTLTYRRVQWAANQHPDMWGGAACNLYRDLIKAGHSAMIPLDFRRHVLPEEASKVPVIKPPRPSNS